MFDLVKLPVIDPAAFLRETAFYCEHLRARLRPEVCAARQAPVQVSFGTPGATALLLRDSHCQTGKCEQGKRVARRLRAGRPV